MSPTLAETLRDTERRRLRALVEGDVQLARSLHADDYQLVTPGGACESKATYLGAIAEGLLDYEVFEADSAISVRSFTDGAALRYRARIEVLVEGKRDGGFFWHTDIYEQRDGGWQVVWSQATRIRS